MRLIPSLFERSGSIGEGGGGGGKGLECKGDGVPLRVEPLAEM